MTWIYHSISKFSFKFIVIILLGGFISEILDRLREIAPQSSFLDITPPYVNGYRVARVFIPEFLAMTFPSFPQLNHPRLRKYINEKYYIHPMP